MTGKTGMTIDEVTKALTRGCCSRKQAADKQCDLCGPRYEAIDQVIRWHTTLDEATAYAREMSAHALESARKRYEAQVALVNVWGLLTREPMQQPVPLGGGGYAELNVPTIAEASNKAVEVVFRAESAERERDEALSMLAALTKAADHVGLMVYPHPLTTDGQRAVVELARTVGDAGAVVARLSREGAGRRPRPTKELEAEILTVVADAGSREACCEDHDRGVAEEHEPCAPPAEALKDTDRDSLKDTTPEVSHRRDDGTRCHRCGGPGAPMTDTTKPITMTPEQEAEIRGLDWMPAMVASLITELDATRARVEAAEARVRELEAERDEARRSLDLSVRAWDTTGGPREGMLALEKVADAARAERAARRAWQTYLNDGGPVAQGITVADAVEALEAALAELDKAGGS